MDSKQFALVNINQIKGVNPETEKDYLGNNLITSSDKRSLLIDNVRICLLNAKAYKDKFADITANFTLRDGDTKKFLVTGLMYDVDNDTIYHFRNVMLASSIRNDKGIGQCIFRTLDKTSPAYGIEFQLTNSNTKLVRNQVKHVYQHMHQEGTLII